MADRLEEAIVDYAADLRRAASHGRRRWTWPGLALAVAVPAFFLLGVLVEQQFAIIPLDDPTGGWRGYIWDTRREPRRAQRSYTTCRDTIRPLGRISYSVT